MICFCQEKKRRSAIEKQRNTSKKFSKADPRWAPFRALKHKELGLLISAREAGLPISLRPTDSVKH